MILLDSGIKKNQGAFSGKLTCPGMVKGLDGVTPEVCGAESWKFMEKLSPYRIRYQCRACGKTIQYDFSANMNHPYAVFGKNKWQRIVEKWKQSKKGQASLGY